MEDGKPEDPKQTRDETDNRIADLVSDYVDLLNSGDGRFPLPEKFALDNELTGDVLQHVLLGTRTAFDLHMEQFRSQVRSIREYALAVVEGDSEQEAFARGKRGEGVPLHDCLPDAPLFDHFYASDKEGQTRRPEAAEWIRGLFAEHDGWHRADATDISDRILEASNEKIRKHGIQWLRDWPESRTWGLVDEALSWRDGVEGVGGRLPLGPDPDFAGPCAQAIGLMLLGDRQPRVLGVLDLPPKDGRRRFLFFGMRSVT